MFMAGGIVCFLGSQVTSKGVIMGFLQDFHPKDLDLGYVQYGSFVEELSTLRPVTEVDISIRIQLPGSQPVGYLLRKGVSSQKFW